MIPSYFLGSSYRLPAYMCGIVVASQSSLMSSLPFWYPEQYFSFSSMHGKTWMTDAVILSQNRESTFKIWTEFHHTAASISVDGQHSCYMYIWKCTVENPSIEASTTPPEGKSSAMQGRKTQMSDPAHKGQQISVRNQHNYGENMVKEKKKSSAPVA